jgi:hypothetical protein
VRVYRPLSPESERTVGIVSKHSSHRRSRPASSR